MLCCSAAPIATHTHTHTHTHTTKQSSCSHVSSSELIARTINADLLFFCFIGFFCTKKARIEGRGLVTVVCKTVTLWRAVRAWPEIESISPTLFGYKGGPLVLLFFFGVSWFS